MRDINMANAFSCRNPEFSIEEIARTVNRANRAGF
jgi:hypothetical protein